jgi:DNA-binding beta-propeller fold protein YncE
MDTGILDVRHQGSLFRLRSVILRITWDPWRTVHTASLDDHDRCAVPPLMTTFRRTLAAPAALLLAVGLVLLAVSDGDAADRPLPLATVARVDLPGHPVRFDYTSIDPATGRLYIAHMDEDQLLVFDTRTRRVLARIHAPGVHGVLAVPALNRVFASATNDHEAITIDTRTDRVVARAPAGSYPDGLAYDSGDRRIFVSDESGGHETVLNASGKRIATISLGGEAGNVQYDAPSRHVLVDVQTRDDIAVIDPRSNRIIGRVSLPGCDHDHGLLVDAPHRLAFVACDSNAMLLTLDLRTMKIIGRELVGANPDVLAYDSSNRRLYVSAESGVVAVFREDAGGLTKLGQAFLATEAHTVAVDPRTHLVYFPLQQGSAGRPQLLIMRPLRAGAGSRRTSP